MTFSPPPPLPWWALRRRAARYRFLECVARTEMRITLDGVDHASRSFEGAYLALIESPDRDVARGLAWVQIVAIRNHHGNHASINMRMPLDVKL